MHFTVQFSLTLTVWRDGLHTMLDFTNEGLLHGVCYPKFDSCWKNLLQNVCEPIAAWHPYHSCWGLNQAFSLFYPLHPAGYLDSQRACWTFFGTWLFLQILCFLVNGMQSWQKHSKPAHKNDHVTNSHTCTHVPWYIDHTELTLIDQCSYMYCKITFIFEKDVKLGCNQSSNWIVRTFEC